MIALIQFLLVTFIAPSSAQAQTERIFMEERICNLMSTEQERQRCLNYTDGQWFDDILTDVCRFDQENDKDPASDRDRWNCLSTVKDMYWQGGMIGDAKYYGERVTFAYGPFIRCSRNIRTPSLINECLTVIKGHRYSAAEDDFCWQLSHSLPPYGLSQEIRREKETRVINCYKLLKNKVREDTLAACASNDRKGFSKDPPEKMDDSLTYECLRLAVKYPLAPRNPVDICVAKFPIPARALGPDRLDWFDSPADQERRASIPRCIEERMQEFRARDHVPISTGDSSRR